jgi:ankyrin repeat protein
MLRLCLRSNVRHFLNELPDTLDKTYERILKDIHKTNRGYAHRLLQCVAMAARPLRVEDLAQLLTLDPAAIEGEVPTLESDWRSEDREQEFLSACPSLITIVGDSFWRGRVVQFSHFSVKEFLTSDRLAAPRKDISLYHILPEVAHTTLARASLGVLLCSNNRFLNPRSYYSAHYWVHHAILIGNLSKSVKHMMQTLFDPDKPHLAAWLQACVSENSPYPPRYPHSHLDTLNPLYHAALWGLYDLAEYLVKKRPQDVNVIRHNGGFCPLVAALEEGHFQIAELLLQHGANVDIRGVDVGGWRGWKEQTPLHHAIGWHNDLTATTVQFLLKHGADVNSRQNDLSTPLHLAAAQGNFDVAQMLLKHGADVNPRQSDLSTPLHLAATQRNLNIAQMLLQYGADVDSEDVGGRTPLHLASSRGDRPIVQLLLEHGAEVNSGRCPALHGATHNLETVRVLVEHGASVNAQNSQGHTPLYYALLCHNKHSVAQLLVEHGADVNASEDYPSTLLQLASNTLDLESVRFLLHHGANVNLKNLPDNDWCPTLVHGVLLPEYVHKRPSKRPRKRPSERHFDAELLVECDTEVNERDQSHITPTLHSLQLKLMQILLDHGADMHVEDEHGQTPFHRVFGFSHFCQDVSDLIQLLVDRGADVNTRNEDHGTLLHLASYRMNLQLVRLLLDHGADVNAEDNQGRARTPLHRVLEADNSEYSVENCFSIARLLVQRGADVTARDKDKITPLHLASRWHILADEHNLVRLFLDHGANVNAEDYRGQTPLHRVLHDKYFSIVQLLVECGADVDARDEQRETPLHLASYLAKPNLVRLFIDHGANAKAEDKWGGTALHRLSDQGTHWRHLVSDEDRFDTAQLLLAQGADVNAQDKSQVTPLHLASSFLGLNLVRLFLDRGANANAEDSWGRTPLRRVPEARFYSFAGKDRVDAARLLMGHGADVNTRDKSYHLTPLHLASYQLELNLVRLFLDHGANVNAKDNQGQTPLHRVLEEEDYLDEDTVGITQLLLEHGANANTPNDAHETPLHLAASRLGSLQVAWMLLKHGADQNMQNKVGKTPFQLVQEKIKKDQKRRPAAYSRERRAEVVALMGLLYGC